MDTMGNARRGARPASRLTILPSLHSVATPGPTPTTCPASFVLWVPPSPRLMTLAPPLGCLIIGTVGGDTLIPTASPTALAAKAKPLGKLGRAPSVTALPSVHSLASSAPLRKTLCPTICSAALMPRGNDPFARQAASFLHPGPKMKRSLAAGIPVLFSRFGVGRPLSGVAEADHRE